MKIQSINRWLVTIAVCLVIFSVFAVYKYNDIDSATEEFEALPELSETVEAVAAETVEYTPAIKALGVVLAPRVVSLSNELPGYITRVNFSSGAEVTKGQVIIQLNVSEERANLASARARAQLAQIVYERDVGLHASNAVSQENVERSRAELDVVKAEIAAVTSVIDRKTIRAPFDGVIGIHQLEPGQYLESSTFITTLVAHSDEMWIDFSVPQFYGELEVGTVVRARRIRSQAAAPAPWHAARIIAGNALISSESRSRLYRATAPGRHLALRHNASVEVEVPVGPPRVLVSVPTRSVQRSVNGSHVFVLEPEPGGQSYRASALPVTVEAEQGGRTYVTGALEAGRLVAVAGAFKLREGVLVHAGTQAAGRAAAGGR